MMKRFYRIAVVSLAVVAVGVIVLVASAELTSRPGFCSTCHYMRPYVDAWETSTHADVTCTDCHFPPGFKSKVKGKFTALSMLVNYATGVYKKSKPWAEISDGSCLRSGCHSERLLEGEVEFREAIVFDHEPHLTSLRREKSSAAPAVTLRSFRENTSLLLSPPVSFVTSRTSRRRRPSTTVPGAMLPPFPRRSIR